MPNCQWKSVQLQLSNLSIIFLKKFISEDFSHQFCAPCQVLQADLVTSQPSLCEANKAEVVISRCVPPSCALQPFNNFQASFVHPCPIFACSSFVGVPWFCLAFQMCDLLWRECQLLLLTKLRILYITSNLLISFHCHNGNISAAVYLHYQVFYSHCFTQQSCRSRLSFFFCRCRASNCFCFKNESIPSLVCKLEDF